MTSLQRVAIVDVETTGLSVAGGGRVIEVAAVVIDAGAIVDEYSTLIDAGAPITWGAQQVHGISSALLRGKPRPESVWPDFVRFAEGATLVAHNAPFDRAFVEFESTRAGCPVASAWDCTLRRSRRCLPQLANHKLATVAEYLLGAWPADATAHRALGDARVTARVWLALLELEAHG